ncbi:MAG: alpha/beta hydrolase [Aquisalimonadaceae bacterium]
MVDFEHTTERVAGCGISVRQGGEGPPLLFLHGAGGGSEWLPFMSELARRYTVIVPEHPGFGDSESPGWLREVGDLAYFYLDFLEQRGLRDVHLVGASLGGWIAAELAVRNQHHLRTLTLVNSAGIHVKGLPRKGDIFLWSREEKTRRLYHDAGMAEAALAVPLEGEAMDRQLKNALTTALLAWQPRLYNPQLIKWLHRITVPTLVLWGAEDQVIPAAYGEQFAQRIPNARLVNFEACGHLPQVECAERFVSALGEFFEEVGP